MTGAEYPISRHGALVASLLFHGLVFGILMFKLAPPTLTSAANAETPAIAIEMITLPVPAAIPVAAVAPAPPPPQALPEVIKEPPPLIESSVAEVVTPPKVEQKPEPEAKPKPKPKRQPPRPVETAAVIQNVETPSETMPTAPAPIVQQAALAAPSGRAGPPPDYLARLHQALERNKEYPRTARAQRQQGRAMLRFAIDRAGNVLDYRLEKSSGYDLLDREVVAMIRRASPLPPMPADMTAERLEIVVPIPFILR